MKVYPLSAFGSPPRCSIVHVPRQNGKRWDLRDPRGVTALTAPDFWTILRRVYEMGFEHVNVEDGGALYHITICEWE